MMRSRGAAAALLTVLFICPSAGVAAAATEPPAKCDVVANGEFPTCHQNPDGTWSVIYTKVVTPVPTGGGGPGIPAGFVALLVVVGVIGVGVTVWRVSTARRLAADAGMDPDTATAVTLLGSPGLDAAYVASAVRGRSEAASQPSAEERLAELKGLLDKGLITQDEYDERRKAILDGV